MSTASLHLPALPDYNTPAYSRNLLDSEQRLDSQPRSTNSLFKKESKSRNLTLELNGQHADSPYPVFGLNQLVQGRVLLLKADSVSSIHIKVSFRNWLFILSFNSEPQLDGHLRIQEIGGAGRAIDKVLSQEIDLWTKDDSSPPSSLEFNLALPGTFTKDDKAYILPPTIDVHLSGVPGFKADVAYTIAVHVNKSKSNIFGNTTRFVNSPHHSNRTEVHQ